MASTDKQTFTGSCHCGNVKYKIKVAPPISMVRCNCTICAKAGFTSLKVDPADFELVSPGSKSDISKYVANPKNQKGNQRYFCQHCGASLCMEGEYEWEGQTVHHFAVNGTLIDQPQEGVDLAEVKVAYLDGLHDNQYAGFKEKPWSGGLV